MATVLKLKYKPSASSNILRGSWFHLVIPIRNRVNFDR